MTFLKNYDLVHFFTSFGFFYQTVEFSSPYLFFLLFCLFFWRPSVCLPLLSFVAHFVFFERCLHGFELGCALTFASEAKFEIEAKISFRLEAKKKPDFT
jgi:hypothetical protein